MQKFFGDLIAADHKIVSEGCEISKQSIDIASRGARLGLPMDPIISVQNKKLLRKHKGAWKSSWSRIGSRKSFYTDNSLEFGKSREGPFPGIIVRQHHTDQKQNEIAEIAVRRVKDGTSAVLLQNQVWMKNGGQIPWNVYTYLRNISRFLV